MTRMTFLGDVFLSSPIDVAVDLGEHVVFNLEAPLTNGGKPATGKINLRARPGSLADSFGTVPRAVCLANNHIMDFGPSGLADTLAELGALGVEGFGAGTFADNCRNPVIVVVDGTRVGMCGYVCSSTSPVVATQDTPGAAPMSSDRVLADMAMARRQGAERVVVQLHWGVEHVSYPSPGDVRLARRLVDAGADLVIGHHAHRIQAFEAYRGRYVFYGLGNAVFPEHVSPAYYTSDGRPTKTRVSRSFAWNKTSIAVRWQPSSGAVEVEALHFDGATLRRGSFQPENFRIRVGTDDAYVRRFHRAYRWGKLQHAIASYLRAPKLPRPRHVAALLRILR